MALVTRKIVKAKAAQPTSPPSWQNPRNLGLHNLGGSELGGNFSEGLGQIDRRMQNYGQGIDSLIGQMGQNQFNYRNPYQQQIGDLMNRMGQSGFNAGQLQNFNQMFNPNNVQGDRPQINPMRPGLGRPNTVQINSGNKQPTLTGGGTGGTAMDSRGGMPPYGNGFPQPPTMERPGYAEQFANTPTNVNPIQMGAGGQFNQQLFGQGMQNASQFGGFGQDTGQARQAQLQGLMGQAAAPGINGQQRQEMFSAAFDPVKQALGQAQIEAQNTLSGRGLGRSSEALGNINQNYMSSLGNAAQQIGSNLTNQDIGLRQQQAQFGLSGLGDYSGLGVNAALGAGGLQNQMQGTANQYNLGMGSLGQGMEGLNAANQQWQQGTQFGQNQARAGMSGDLAAQRNQEMLNLYGTQGQFGLGNRGLNEQIAARQAGNALDTTRLGMQAQGMNTDALGQYGNFLGNMSGQAGQDYGMNQGFNLQNQNALAGILQNMYGNQMGQYENARGNQLGWAGLGEQGMQRRQDERLASRGGGVAGFLGNLAGTAAGGWAGGGFANPFGGGQQQGGYGTMPQGYRNQWNLNNGGRGY